MRLVHGGAEQAELLFGAFALGDIAHDDGIELPSMHLDARHGGFDWEALTAGAHAARARPNPGGQRAVAAGGVVVQLVDVLDNEAADMLPQRLGGRAAEHAFGGGVEQRDALIGSGHQDGILGGADDAGQAGFRLRQPVLHLHLPQHALDGVRQVVEIFLRSRARRRAALG